MMHLIAPGQYGARWPVDSKETIPFDLTELNHLAATAHTLDILNSPELFFLLFCRREHALDNFKVFFDDSRLTLKGESALIKGVASWIEQFRLLLIDGFSQRKKVVLALVDITSDLHMRKIAPVIDCLDWLHDSAASKKIRKRVFDDYIQPSLASFIKELGGIYQEKKEIHTFKDLEGLGLQKQLMLVIQIDWEPTALKVYPIEPKDLSKNSQTMDRSSFYSLYKQGILCDTTIISKTQQKFQIHSLLLYSFGGEMLQALLTGAYKESKNKEIHFETFESEVLELFIDYIYQGQKIAFEKLMEKGNKELAFQTFGFANLYAIPQFVDCCTNAISLLCDAQDIERIKEEAKLHENPHLAQLADYYSLPALDQLTTKV